VLETAGFMIGEIADSKMTNYGQPEPKDRGIGAIRSRAREAGEAPRHNGPSKCCSVSWSSWNTHGYVCR
jgi:hypothetical protein